eukprot:362556-Chlamydomonas_euryale.AAC.5
MSQYTGFPDAILYCHAHSICTATHPMVMEIMEIWRWRFRSPYSMSASKIVAARMGVGCMGAGAHATAPTGCAFLG